MRAKEDASQAWEKVCVTYEKLRWHARLRASSQDDVHVADSLSSLDQPAAAMDALSRQVTSLRRHKAHLANCVHLVAAEEHNGAKDVVGTLNRSFLACLSSQHLRRRTKELLHTAEIRRQQVLAAQRQLCQERLDRIARERRGRLWEQSLLRSERDREQSLKDFLGARLRREQIRLRHLEPDGDAAVADQEVKRLSFDWCETNMEIEALTGSVISTRPLLPGNARLTGGSLATRPPFPAPGRAT